MCLNCSLLQVNWAACGLPKRFSCPLPCQVQLSNSKLPNSARKSKARCLPPSNQEQSEACLEERLDLAVGVDVLVHVGLELSLGVIVLDVLALDLAVRDILHLDLVIIAALFALLALGAGAAGGGLLYLGLLGGSGFGWGLGGRLGGRGALADAELALDLSKANL